MSKFYRRHYELVFKYDNELKPLLLQGLSEFTFYGDLVYKFRKILGKPEFSDNFSKIVICYKWKEYDIAVIKTVCSACLATNPVTVDHFAILFNYTPVGRNSDYDGPDLKNYSFSNQIAVCANEVYAFFV